MSAFDPKLTLRERELSSHCGILRGPSRKERLGKGTLVKLYEFSGLPTVQIAQRNGVGSP